MRKDRKKSWWWRLKLKTNRRVTFLYHQVLVSMKIEMEMEEMWEKNDRDSMNMSMMVRRILRK